ncbi:MAG TPA: hypothetical protein DDW90_10710 [Cyanobacteria bacterium UBA9971]|nr:hypothetical protein [Cyanobacteria bacterium UBA9971]
MKIKFNPKAFQETLEMFGTPDRLEFFYENGYVPKLDSEKDESLGTSNPDEKLDVQESQESAESKTHKLKLVLEKKTGEAYMLID